VSLTEPASPAVRGAPRRRGSGQALVEFSLIIPLFLTALFAIIDVGHVIWTQNVVASAAREGARYAIVHGGSTSNPCPVGPPHEDTIIPAASSTCPYPSPSKQAIVDVVRNYAVGAGGTMTVNVCYGDGCSGAVDTVGATNARNTPVTVTVSGQVGLITGGFLGIGPFGVSATTTMLVNH
jgi:hypothetical protein